MQLDCQSTYAASQPDGVEQYCCIGTPCAGMPAHAVHCAAQVKCGLAHSTALYIHTYTCVHSSVCLCIGIWFLYSLLDISILVVNTSCSEQVITRGINDIVLQQVTDEWCKNSLI